MLLFRQGSPAHGISPLAVSTDSQSTVAVIPPIFDRWATSVASILAEAEIREGVVATHRISVNTVAMQVDWLDCAARIIDDGMGTSSAIPDCILQ